MFHVYVLQNRHQGTLYTGQTDDLERRVHEHNDPTHHPARYTAKVPGQWDLVHSEEFETRGAAMRREKWLKSGVGRDWIRKLLGSAKINSPIAQW
jgi:putative endonuclease